MNTKITIIFSLLLIILACNLGCKKVEFSSERELENYINSSNIQFTDSVEIDGYIYQLKWIPNELIARKIKETALHSLDSIREEIKDVLYMSFLIKPLNNKVESIDLVSIIKSLELKYESKSLKMIDYQIPETYLLNKGYKALLAFEKPVNIEYNSDLIIFTSDFADVKDLKINGSVFTYCPIVIEK